MLYPGGWPYSGSVPIRAQGSAKDRTSSADNDEQKQKQKHDGRCMDGWMNASMRTFFAISFLFGLI